MKQLRTLKVLFAAEKFYCIILVSIGKQTTAVTATTVYTRKKKLRQKMKL
jgi:hypothetical protein